VGGAAPQALLEIYFYYRCTVKTPAYKQHVKISKSQYTEDLDRTDLDFFSRVWDLEQFSQVWDLDLFSRVWDLDLLSLVWDLDLFSLVWDLDLFSLV
jgi:hypothetical protein